MNDSVYALCWVAIGGAFGASMVAVWPVELLKSMIARIREATGYAVAGLIIVVAGVVVGCACLALLPVRWIIDWSARRERRAPPNDPSSATRPTRASACNRDGMAGFAAAHG